MEQNLQAKSGQLGWLCQVSVPTHQIWINIWYLSYSLRRMEFASFGFELYQWNTQRISQSMLLWSLNALTKTYNNCSETDNVGGVLSALVFPLIANLARVWRARRQVGIIRDEQVLHCPPSHPLHAYFLPPCRAMVEEAMYWELDCVLRFFFEQKAVFGGSQVLLNVPELLIF